MRVIMSTAIDVTESAAFLDELVSRIAAR